MILYSIRSLSEGYMIAKFDNDFDIEATYEVSPFACSCPAFPRRQSCKHQDILAKFITREKVDSEWFYCRESDSWHNPLGLESMPRIETSEPATDEDGLEVEFEDEDENEIKFDEPAVAAPAGPSEVASIPIRTVATYLRDEAASEATTYTEAEDPSLNNPTLPLPEPIFKRRI